MFRKLCDVASVAQSSSSAGSKTNIGAGGGNPESFRDQGSLATIITSVTLARARSLHA